jgi:alpha-glucosidase
MHEWWQRGTIYQIYPRSFYDTNGDGIGDLAGIVQKLWYLEWLGVDAIWISPIYPSPMADFGYDVSDFTAVDPVFGTLDDFDALIAAAHGHGIRVILDLVPNHTSDRHPWFEQSRQSTDNPRRDWYIWRPGGPADGPPNNWRSVFGGSAWEFDPTTGEYYYHAFLKEQPDLNWRNPKVREAMIDVMRFWLDRGVDGFRVDVIWQLVKDASFRDNPVNPGYGAGQPAFRELLATYTADLPEVHDIISMMRSVVDEYAERVIIGEIYLPIERLVVYYGASGDGVHLPFNFQLIELPWHAAALTDAVARYEALLPSYGWPNWVLGNHDKQRIASRVGIEQARTAAMLLLTLRGTPTLYYGDELGMQDVAIPPERVMDPWEKNEPGLGVGRDPVRTPMQWSDAPHAGFSTAMPWLPIAPDFAMTNVSTEQADTGSTLSLYRELLRLRRQEPALHIGGYSGLPASGDIVSYVRHHGDSRFLILLNLATSPDAYHAGRLGSGRIVLSTYLDRRESFTDQVLLRPSEGVVIRLT